MKRIIASLFSLFLLLGCLGTALATQSLPDETQAATPTAPVQEEKPPDMSTPRLMVTSYSLDTKDLTPGKTSLLKITLHNFSETKSLRNIKLSIADESGQIEIEGMGTQYLRRIYVGGDYVWEVKLTALPTAEIGKHKLTVTGEYEDLYYTPFSSSDTVALTVKQSVGVDHSGIEMPVKITEGTTYTMDVTLMNTGKTDVRNCKLTFKSKTLESAGTTFVGEIPAGASVTATLNYKQPLGKLGETSATLELSYEDVFGNQKKEKVTVSTVVEKKVEQQEEDTEKKPKYRLWWLFISVGAILGGALGYGIPTAIRSKKQRKEDELRL